MRICVLIDFLKSCALSNIPHISEKVSVFFFFNYTHFLRATFHAEYTIVAMPNPKAKSGSVPLFIVWTLDAFGPVFFSSKCSAVDHNVDQIPCSTHPAVKRRMGANKNLSEVGTIAGNRTSSAYWINTGRKKTVFTKGISKLNMFSTHHSVVPEEFAIRVGNLEQKNPSSCSSCRNGTRWILETIFYQSSIYLNRESLSDAFESGSSTPFGMETLKLARHTSSSELYRNCTGALVSNCSIEKRSRQRCCRTNTQRIQSRRAAGVRNGFCPSMGQPSFQWIVRMYREISGSKVSLSLPWNRRSSRGGKNTERQRILQQLVRGQQSPTFFSSISKSLQSTWTHWQSLGESKPHSDPVDCSYTPWIEIFI